MKLAEHDTWPDLRFVVHLLPWTWRLWPRWYRDDIERGYMHFSWLFLEAELWWNWPPFTYPASKRGSA